MNAFVQVLGFLLASFSAMTGILVTIRLNQPSSPIWWVFKVFACALSPFAAMAGVFSFILGIFSGNLWISIPGALGTLATLIYVSRIDASVSTSLGFLKAFGPAWKNSIPANLQAHFLKNATAWKLPDPSGFNLIQNIPFCSVPGTSRQLLCDLWQPAQHVKPSGLAFIYFHGSAWCVLDKDFGTRPLFQHLVSQGHVIMDVAYRLFPEANMAGMVHDVYRAIAWMKSNAPVYGVNPDRIVIGGGSAGAQLSMLAAYAGNGERLVPAELQGADLSVCGVISLYGPSDLKALYFHTGQHITTRKKPAKSREVKPMPNWVRKMMGESYHRLGMDKNTQPGILPYILGCQPDECPELYKTFSPITHVHKDCPPTLLIQGEHDVITPVKAARNLYNRLEEANVPTVMYLAPQTDHAFDLVLTRISPVAHTAFYFVERFLALMLTRADLPSRSTSRKVLLEAEELKG